MLSSLHFIFKHRKTFIFLFGFHIFFFISHPPLFILITIFGSFLPCPCHGFFQLMFTCHLSSLPWLQPQVFHLQRVKKVNSFVLYLRSYLFSFLPFFLFIVFLFHKNKNKKIKTKTLWWEQWFEMSMKRYTISRAIKTVKSESEQMYERSLKHDLRIDYY